MRYFSILVTVLAFAASGCKKGPTGLFTAPYVGTISIPNGWFPNVIHPATVKILAGNLDSSARLNNVLASNIAHILPSTMTLLAKTPGDDFNWVSEVEVFISAKGYTTTNIYYRVDLQGPGQRIDLIPLVDMVDLKPFLARPDWSLEIRFTLLDGTPHNIQADVNFSFLAQ